MTERTEVSLGIAFPEGLFQKEYPSKSSPHAFEGPATACGLAAI